MCKIRAIWINLEANFRHQMLTNRSICCVPFKPFIVYLSKYFVTCFTVDSLQSIQANSNKKFFLFKTRIVIALPNGEKQTRLKLLSCIYLGWLACTNRTKKKTVITTHTVSPATRYERMSRRLHTIETKPIKNKVKRWLTTPKKKYIVWKYS